MNDNDEISQVEAIDKNKYSESIKRLSFEQLVYERAIINQEKTNIYIKDKELDNEFLRRLRKE